MSEYALEITDLKKVYDNDVVALKGIDLKITKGDFFALLGPNGAGKTTIFRMIQGETLILRGPHGQSIHAQPL